MRPAASRAGSPPLSALIPIEKNGSPQGVTSQATRWRVSRRQREPGARAKSRQARACPGPASRRAAATRAGWTRRRTCRIVLTLFGPSRGGAARLHGTPGSRLRRRGGGSLRLRDRGVTLVTTTAGRGLLCRRHALRLRLGGRDLGAVRRLRGGTRRLGRGGSGGRRRERRLGGECRGGQQAGGQQGRSDSLH